MKNFTSLVKSITVALIITAKATAAGYESNHHWRRQELISLAGKPFLSTMALVILYLVAKPTLVFMKKYSLSVSYYSQLLVI